MLVVMPIYGVQVCPFLEDQNPLEVIATIDGVLLLAYFVRHPLYARVVESGPLTGQAMRVFVFEFVLLLSAGVVLTVYNMLVNDFPLVSGLKIIVGLGAMGFFAGADLALERERLIAVKVEREGLMLHPEGRYFPLTSKLALFAGLSVMLVVGILALLVVKDLDWLVETGNAVPLSHARLSILKEFGFALMIVLPEALNIIVSYSRNLNLFLQRENAVLERVSVGQYEAQVPVSSNDEFGVMAAHTNGMIARVRERTEELHRKNIELGSALQQVSAEHAAKTEAMRARLEAESANREKSAFLANMSHELRTPLNAIIGYSEILQEDAQERADKTAVADLRKIVTAGHHLLSLINDVLDLSKIEAGKMQLAPETFTVRALVDDVLTLVEPLLEKGRNRLEVRSDIKSAAIHTDPIRLRQILFNLLSNACKFTRDGTIAVSVSHHDHNNQAGFEFSVRDTGAGIAPEDLAQLFQPFVQADSVGRKHEGTGLGLALCRRFCEMMGGNISASSTIGQGSEFRFWLPVGDTRLEAGAG